MNNVNMQALQEFVATLQKDPAEGKKNKAVSGGWNFDQGQPQFVSTLQYANGKVTLNTELPPFSGGWGNSPDPIQYCLHGLAACFAVTFAAVAAQEGVKLTRLEVTAENWMDLRKQMGLSSDNIVERVKFTVRAEDAPRETLQRLVDMTEKRCPGTECVTRQIPLQIELA